MVPLFWPCEGMWLGHHENSIIIAVLIRRRAHRGLQETSEQKGHSCSSVTTRSVVNLLGRCKNDLNLLSAQLIQVTLLEGSGIFNGFYCSDLHPLKIPLPSNKATLRLSFLYMKLRDTHSNCTQPIAPREQHRRDEEEREDSSHAILKKCLQLSCMYSVNLNWVT